MSETQMIDSEHVRGVANKVLSEFTTQEMGNKVTQFNMQGLANILVGMMMNPDSLKTPEEGQAAGPDQQPAEVKS
jgi:hypothetical protein